MSAKSILVLIASTSFSLHAFSQSKEQVAKEIQSMISSALRTLDSDGTSNAITIDEFGGVYCTKTTANDAKLEYRFNLLDIKHIKLDTTEQSNDVVFECKDELCINRTGMVYDGSDKGTNRLFVPITSRAMGDRIVARLRKLRSLNQEK